MRPGIIGVSPMRDKEWAFGADDIEAARTLVSDRDWLVGASSRAIGARDFYDVSNVDMVLAYLPAEAAKTAPSLGTIMEIGWAIALRKPVVLVTDREDLATHPLVHTHVDWIVPELELGVIIVNSVLGVYI